MRRRILLAILLAVLVTGVALGAPLGVTGVLLVENFHREELTNSAQRIAAALDNQLANRHNLNLRHIRSAMPRDAHLVVHHDSAAIMEAGPSTGDDVISEQQPIAGGHIVMTQPAGEMRTQQTQVAVAVVFVVVLSVGIGTFVATVTANRLARPLRHVADRAARLGAGDFRPDNRRYAVAELDMVADALDSSGTALAQLVQRERQLVGDVSHQLRSRLTALQLRLEALGLHQDPEVTEEAHAALEQSDRLAGALDELLAAARAASEVGTEPVSLTTMLPEVSDEWRDVLKAEGRTLRLRIADGLMVRVTPARLREIISVLLDNAMRHGAGTVTLAARRGDTDGTVVVEVSDAGPGVPDELAPHVFDRGFSGAGSTGVGLALARALAEADGGRLELSTRAPATFSLFLRVPTAGDVPAVEWPTERVPR
ncbi:MULTISPECIES: ATP-binding protein [Prauserella salsuginis group]|uniref:Signal transduction histidine-protein kinase/phosphatase MprB n=1 Tax=Prauserella salsuginis TaxID=387889 RepID=A0ABW6G6S9_9PSEU|nr:MULTISPECIES: ATP-binding protein [Prauserella salsuginis group]MCR3722699.1 Signal transduction histidine kinase [Prauserella flava]MCR3737246.1 Signal transduction histidine kinase [Prauserella salsuginis]